MPPLRLTRELPGSGGRLDAVPEDFEVHEILPYPPSGEGTHLFVRLEKVGLTTLEAARRIAQAAGLEVRGGLPPEVGIAGLKDRHARATQWLSLPARPGIEAILAGFDEGELRVLELARHGHKLRRGHQRGNRFVVTIRGVAPGGVARAQAILEVLRVRGVPNGFGAQRFGKDRDNAERARRILAGAERAPRERRIRDLLFSALQSEVFNRVLELRLEGGLFDRVIPGDLAQKHATGGMFEVEDAEREQPRAAALEISATGPLPGRKTRAPAKEALALEAEVLSAAGITPELAARLGEGTRRVLRYPLDPSEPETRREQSDQTRVGSASPRPGPEDREARIEPLGDDAYRASFTLPSGAYATVLLDELVKPEGEALARSFAGAGPAEET